MEKDIVAIHKQKVAEEAQIKHDKKVGKFVRGVEKNMKHGNAVMRPSTGDEDGYYATADVFTDAHRVLSEKGVEVAAFNLKDGSLVDGSKDYFHYVAVLDTEDPAVYERIVSAAEEEAYKTDEKRTERIEGISDYVLKKANKGDVDIYAKTGTFSKTHAIKGNELAAIQTKLSNKGITVEPNRVYRGDEGPGTLLEVTHVEVDD